MNHWWAALPNWAKLLAAAAMVQAVFWFALKPVLFAGNEAEFERFEPRQIATAKLDAPTLLSSGKAEWEPVEALPAWHCCEPGYRALRYNITLEGIPEKGLGIRPRVNADNLALYVNGAFIAGAGRMALPDITYNALLRQTYHVPASSLKIGDNEFVVLMVRDAAPYFDYYEPVIGEYSSMKSAQSYRMFFLGGYKYLALGIISLIALFSAIVAFRAERKQEALWFTCLSISWTLLSLHYLVVDPPLSGNARLGFYFCASLAIPFCWFGLVNAWQNARWKYAGMITVLGYLAVCCAMVISLFALPSGAGFDQAGMLHDYATLAVAVATIVLLASGFTRLGDGRHWEAAVIILLVTLIALNALSELSSTITLGFLSHTQPFLIVGLAAAFLSRNVRLFRSSAQINRELSGQLAERSKELEEMYARERVLVKSQAHAEERRRIMRDMHDGLGSQLISMLMMARRGKGKPEEFEQGLQQVIDEMRLMIDSMDSVGESLDSALATFNRRLMSRLKDAGFSSRWHRDEDLPRLDMSPGAILQVFRIMQEAVTNALKHSHGHTIDVSIMRAPDPDYALRIVVADNGKGISTKRRTSQTRGLHNMESRARSIDANFSVNTGKEGTQVLLDLKPTVLAGRDNA